MPDGTFGTPERLRCTNTGLGCTSTNTLAKYEHFDCQSTVPPGGKTDWTEYPAHQEPGLDGVPVMRTCPGTHCDGTPPVASHYAKCMDCQHEWDPQNM